MKIYFKTLDDRGLSTQFVILLNPCLTRESVESTHYSLQKTKHNWDAWMKGGAQYFDDQIRKNGRHWVNMGEDDERDSLNLGKICWDLCLVYKGDGEKRSKSTKEKCRKWSKLLASPAYQRQNFTMKEYSIGDWAIQVRWNASPFGTLNPSYNSPSAKAQFSWLSTLSCLMRVYLKML